MVEEWRAKPNRQCLWTIREILEVEQWFHPKCLSWTTVDGGRDVSVPHSQVFLFSSCHGYSMQLTINWHAWIERGSSFSISEHLLDTGSMLGNTAGKGLYRRWVLNSRRPESSKWVRLPLNQPPYLAFPTSKLVHICKCPSGNQVLVNV